MHVIVGSVVIRDNKILLVQEAQEKCYKQWNFPAGHLEDNETIVAGAIRETKEETGYDVKPESLAMIASPEADPMIFFLFNMKIIGGEIAYDKSEILDVKWTPLNEVEQVDFRGNLKTFVDEVLRRYKADESYSLDVIEDFAKEKNA